MALFDHVRISFLDVSVMQIDHHGLVIFEIVNRDAFTILANHIGWI